MTQPSYQRYDFAAAARVALPLRQKLNAWTRKAAELMMEQWLGVSQSPINSRAANIDARTFGQIQDTWRAPSCGIPITFWEGKLPGLVVAENRQIRFLLMEILGGDQEDAGEQELTSIETSLATLVFELVAVSFSEAWLDQQALSFDLGTLDPNPSRNRLFAADRELLISGLQIEVGGQLANIQLILAKDDTLQLLRVEAIEKARGNSNKTIATDRIATIDVTVKAELGSATINMSDLVSLAPDDIVVLHQSIEEPIQVTANGQPLASAWPGRQLNQQVLSIESLQ